MSYRSAAEGGWCPGTAAQLREMHCQLEITVMRQARWKFVELEKQGGASTSSSAQDEVQDACRR